MGTHWDSSSEGTNEKRAASEAATVTQSGGRLGERPLPEQGGGYGACRYRERAAVTGNCRNRAAGMARAVAGTGRRVWRVPSQDKGGGYRAEWKCEALHSAVIYCTVHGTVQLFTNLT